MKTIQAIVLDGLGIPFTTWDAAQKAFSAAPLKVKNAVCNELMNNLHNFNREDIALASWFTRERFYACTQVKP